MRFLVVVALSLSLADALKTSRASPAHRVHRLEAEDDAPQEPAGPLDLLQKLGLPEDQVNRLAQIAGSIAEDDAEVATNCPGPIQVFGPGHPCDDPYQCQNHPGMFGSLDASQAADRALFYKIAMSCLPDPEYGGRDFYRSPEGPLEVGTNLRTCQRYGQQQLNDPCWDSVQCALGLYCNGSFYDQIPQATPGSCIPFVQVGGDCVHNGYLTGATNTPSIWGSSYTDGSVHFKECNGGLAGRQTPGSPWLVCDVTKNSTSAPAGWPATWSGTCQEHAPLCYFDRSAPVDPCTADQVCDYTKNMCVPSTGIVFCQPGGPCDEGFCAFNQTSGSFVCMLGDYSIGKPCLSTEQCQRFSPNGCSGDNGTFCHFKTHTCEHPADLGEACKPCDAGPGAYCGGTPDGLCGMGLFCQSPPNSTEGVCAHWAEVGETCYNHYECAGADVSTIMNWVDAEWATVWCNTTTWKCQAPKEAGEPCLHDWECAGFNLSWGQSAFCGSKHVCMEVQELAEMDGSTTGECKWNNNCVSSQPGPDEEWAGFCMKSSGDADWGWCTAPGHAGEPCDVDQNCVDYHSGQLRDRNSGEPLGPPLWNEHSAFCNEHHECAGLSIAGGECREDRHCVRHWSGIISDWCNQGVCSHPSPIGKPCTQDIHCVGSISVPFVGGMQLYPEVFCGGPMGETVCMPLLKLGEVCATNGVMGDWYTRKFRCEDRINDTDVDCIEDPSESGGNGPYRCMKIMNLGERCDGNYTTCEVGLYCSSSTDDKCDWRSAGQATTLDCHCISKSAPGPSGPNQTVPMINDYDRDCVADGVANDTLCDPMYGLECTFKLPDGSMRCQGKQDINQACAWSGIPSRSSSGCKVGLACSEGKCIPVEELEGAYCNSQMDCGDDTMFGYRPIPPFPFFSSPLACNYRSTQYYDHACQRLYSLPSGSFAYDPSFCIPTATYYENQCWENHGKVFSENRGGNPAADGNQCLQDVVHDEIELGDCEDLCRPVDNENYAGVCICKGNLPSFGQIFMCLILPKDIPAIVVNGTEVLAKPVTNSRVVKPRINETLCARPACSEKPTLDDLVKWACCSAYNGDDNFIMWDGPDHKCLDLFKEEAILSGTELLSQLPILGGECTAEPVYECPKYVTDACVTIGTGDVGCSDLPRCPFSRDQLLDFGCVLAPPGGGEAGQCVTGTISTVPPGSHIFL